MSDLNAQSFFLVAVPGLEDLVRAELREWYPDLEATVEHGGVSLHAPLSVGLGLNFALKTPTRILWRIADFRVRDFPKLYNKISLLPWNDWLVPDAQLDIQVATRLSRLKIKKRIEESCLEGYRKARGLTTGPRANVVRADPRRRVHAEFRYIGRAPYTNAVIARTLGKRLCAKPWPPL